MVSTTGSGSNALSNDTIRDLIIEGMSPVVTGAQVDLDRYCKLVQGLVDSCLLQTSPTQSVSLEDIIGVVHRQISAHSGILGHNTSDRIPFFKWIIPRLIAAASRQPFSADAAIKLCDAIDNIVSMLRRGQQDAQGRPKGDRQMRLTLKHLTNSAQDMAIGNSFNLFGYSAVPHAAITIMCICRVVLWQSSALPSNIWITAVRLLTTTLKTCKPGSEDRKFALTLVDEALSLQVDSPYLMALCEEVAQWDDSGSFLTHINSKSPSLRFAVWSTINRMTTHTPQQVEFLAKSVRDWQSETSAWEAGGDQNKPGAHASEVHSRKRKRDAEVQVNDHVKEDLGIEVTPERWEELCRDVPSLPPNVVDKVIRLYVQSVEDAILRSATRTLPTTCISLWTVLLDHGQVNNSLLALGKTLFDHVSPQCLLEQHDLITARLCHTLRSKDRHIRLLAGRLILSIYRKIIDAPNTIVTCLKEALPRAPTHSYEATLMTLGGIGRIAKESDLCPILEALFSRLGSASPVRNLAYSELLEIARHRGKNPYTLVSPYLESISVMLAGYMVSRPDVVSEAIHYIGQSRQSFVENTVTYMVPAMVLDNQIQVLDQIAAILQKSVGELLVQYAAPILTKIFLTTDNPGSYLDALIVMMKRSTKLAQGSFDISISSLITSCAVPFVVSLVFELGDDGRVKQAKKALQYAQLHKESSTSSSLGAFIKPYMLGIMTHLNDTLHDMRGKKSSAYKCKIVKSLGRLIELVGGSMLFFTPQIIASLQSLLALPELRRDVLGTWFKFVSIMKHKDVSPFIGRTTGSIVAYWDVFDNSERAIATSIVRACADNVNDFGNHLDEVVGLDMVPELKDWADILTGKRSQRNFGERLAMLLDRLSSQNMAVSLASIRELRQMLIDNTTNFHAMALGDTFDPILTRLMSSLLSISTRDEDWQAIKTAGYECLGILGALDPDRFVPHPESVPITVMSNFTDHNESIEFALHLIRDVLVDAIRATNDTKLQGHLSFAIQELLSFCGFTESILDEAKNAKISKTTRDRWQSLPKDQLETLTPLLAARFSLPSIRGQSYTYPIYPTLPTYREWLQAWTSDLVNKLYSDKSVGAPADSQSIFGVFRGIFMRNQDVSIAHHILPHLVLSMLLSENPIIVADIQIEINAVLQDQVNIGSPNDKRSYSAQVIFDLMDHLSKWLRLQQTARSDRRSRIEVIEAVVTGIDTELMANAALQSKAFARSLRNFEQRILQLRALSRSDDELETYFERLHQIYAELDEPDGMEGVSNFVVTPALEHQIREHESTGRWTSAQSCWEVKLQQSPEDPSLHVGLLKCLKNLGHYDTLRNHIRGVLTRRPEWAEQISPFEAEAAWITGDWSTVRRVGGSSSPLAPVLLALHSKGNIDDVVDTARREIGSKIISREYGRSHDAVLQLHLLHEIHTICRSDHGLASKGASLNQVAVKRKSVESVIDDLSARLNSASPAFHVQEAILTIRRTAFGLVSANELKEEVGRGWIASSKIARKAGYLQTAYSAALQAQEANAQFAFIQQAKLTRVNQGAFKALTSLENSIKPILKASGSADRSVVGYALDRQLAKAVLLEARWANETDRFEINEVLDRFRKAISLAPHLESPYYYLGHFYDNMVATPDEMASFNYYTCQNYILALQHGVKYIYQTLPRMLTIWLDLGEPKDPKILKKTSQWLTKITSLVEKSRKDFPAYTFLVAYPQIVSRIGHSHKEVSSVLRKIMALVISRFPHQALWPTVGVMQSNRNERKTACEEVLSKARSHGTDTPRLIAQAQLVSSLLLRLSEAKVDKKREKDVSVTRDFPFVNRAFPSTMIVPLQDAITPTLPAGPDTLMGHNPFPLPVVTIEKLHDTVEIMPSLQKPKKIVFIGSNGVRYPFLCKPHDDLRKDARLMDFNSMINKLLKRGTESRRRHLYIRTYAVMPLNEECGLIEWVGHTNALKSILEKEYHRQNKKLFTAEMHASLEEARNKGSAHQVKLFKGKIIPLFSPTVFYQWFLTTWPEPSAWLASRSAYARTLAVMSMIGYVIGLGDRHGENILFDTQTGDTVHVDLNCLFDKGRTFSVPEKVPFRLTHNMVEALGVTGVEGIFRKAAEISMGTLRTHRESLMSVLEAFAHDPLVEWSARQGKNRSDQDIRIMADRNLHPIREKLRGYVIGQEGTATVTNQVDSLIKSATSSQNLAVMYQGWAPWL